MTSRTRRLTAATLTVVGVLGLLAAPAAAVVPYSVEADRGRIQVGSTFGVNVPGTLGNCPVDIDLIGTIDDSTTTDNIGGSLVVSAPFTDAMFGGSYIWTITGTSTGANQGDLAPPTGAFSGLVVPSATYAIRALNPTTCVPGTSTLCSGTLTLTLGGTFALPLSSLSPATISSSSGSITTRSACSFPFSVSITVGATVAVTRHPAFPSDPGMLFS